MIPAVLFYLFGAGSLATAACVVFGRRAVESAMWLIACFFFLSAEFLLLGFPFLAALQIMVYVGAIMVLFLFVIMLLGVQGVQPLRGRTAVTAGMVVAVMLASLGVIAAAGHAGLTEQPAPPDMDAMTRALFTDYLLPFELTSVLLVAAIAGALTLGRSPRTPDPAAPPEERP